MKTKPVVILLALIFPLTAAAFPGGKGDAEGYHARRMERLNQELNLTEDQKAQVESVFNEQSVKFKAIHEETQSRLKTILTPEQYTKMQEMKKRRHEQWREKHKERRLEETGPAQ